MGIYQIGCTEAIVQEVQSGFTQKAIALSYASAIRSAAANIDVPDWPAINGAILARWNHGVLDRIKKRAFDICSGKVQQ